MSEETYQDGANNSRLVNISAIYDEDGSTKFINDSLSSSNFDGYIFTVTASIGVTEVYAGQLIGIQQSSSSTVNFYPIVKVEAEDPILTSPYTGAHYIYYLDNNETFTSSYSSSAASVIVKYDDWDNKDLGTNGWTITSNGNAIFSNIAARGRIEATSGFIGDAYSGWEIGANLLSNASVGLYAPSAFSSAEIAIFSGSPFTGRDTAPFRVNYGGNLFATGASITGNINAQSGTFTGSVTAQTITASNGTIGGFTIGSDRLSATNLRLLSASGGIITASGAQSAISMLVENNFSRLQFDTSASVYPTKSRIMSGVYLSQYPVLEIRGFGPKPTSASDFFGAFQYPNITIINGDLSGFVGSDSVGTPTASSNSVFINAQHMPTGSTNYFNTDLSFSEGATYLKSARVTLDAYTDKPSYNFRRIKLLTDPNVSVTLSKDIGVGINTVPTVPFEVSGNTIISGNFTVDTNTLFVDSTSNRVGIGTISPASAFHVTGSALFDSSVFVSGKFSANNANISGSITSASITSTFGIIAGWTLSASALTAGTGASTVGFVSTPQSNNIILYAGSATPSSAPFRVTYAGNLIASSVTVNGNLTVGGPVSLTGTSITLGTSSAATEVRSQAIFDTLTANVATVQIAGAANNYRLQRSTASSRKWKHDIKDMPSILQDVLNLRPVTFKYNLDYLPSTDNRSGLDVYGLIAEEVADVIPLAADYDEGQPSDWNYRILVPILIKAIQEQQEQIEELSDRINSLGDNDG